MRKCLNILPFLAFLAAPTMAQDVDIMTAIETANARFSGQIIAADLGDGRAGEPDQIYSLRMLTEAGDVIEIRIDAAAGDIIEVNGRGLVEARRPMQGGF